MAAIRTRNSYLRALYERQRSRIGRGKAIGAVKHSTASSTRYPTTRPSSGLSPSTPASVAHGVRPRTSHDRSSDGSGARSPASATWVSTGSWPCPWGPGPR